MTEFVATLPHFVKKMWCLANLCSIFNKYFAGKSSEISSVQVCLKCKSDCLGLVATNISQKRDHIIVIITISTDLIQG